jgi:transglutaminase-like putative cysteine protease
MTLHHSWDRYLAETPEIDFGKPSIRDLVATSDWLEAGEIDRVRLAFEFVRDEVPHSWDIQAPIVTCAASEVLAERTGICYAKSLLLAALLRAMAIPSGVCYQRLVLFEDPADGYALHSLNAAYLSSLDRWVRFDARGNKPGVDAQFSVDREQLAFNVRPEMGEVDYPGIYAEPPAIIVETLRRFTDSRQMYEFGLPDTLALA